MNHKYLTERERYKIETYLEEGYRPAQIAEKIGCCRATVYNEIKRGRVEYLDKYLCKKTRYDAYAGQRVMEERSHNKGIDYKIGNDFAYVRMVEKLILKRRYSPYACIAHISRHCPEIKTRVCLTTLYSYIDKGLFLNVKRDSLPFHKKRPHKAAERPSVALHNLRGESIENRPKAVNGRVSFGDWEMDTIVSGKEKGTACLLVMTERKHRIEIIRRMDDKKADSTIRQLDQLEKTLGSPVFGRTFRTITTDNGVEFLNGQGIEKSINGGRRTKSYYCHPYRSNERGSNEKQNQLIRRLIPRGADISKLSPCRIRYVEHWLNTYPRKMFGGLSALDMLKQDDIFPTLGN